jgi:hypothetical protein
MRVYCNWELGEKVNNEDTIERGPQSRELKTASSANVVTFTLRSRQQGCGGGKIPGGSEN